MQPFTRRVLPVGTRLLLRDVIFSRLAENCYPYVEAEIAANSGEPEIETFRATAEQEKECHHEWFGALPGGFVQRLAPNGTAASGTATVSGEMGLESFTGCTFEGSAMSEGVSLSLRYLSLGVTGTFSLVDNERLDREPWKQELAKVLSELKRVYAAMQELNEEGELSPTQEEEFEALSAEAGHLEASQRELEQEIAGVEGECEEAEVGMLIEDEGVALERRP